MDMNEVLRGQAQQPALVAAAMITGIVLFAAVSMIVTQDRDPDSKLTRTMYIVMAVVAAGGIVVTAVARRFALSRGRRAWQKAGDDVAAARGALSQAVTPWFVVPAAAAEALGLLAVVSYMVTGSWPAMTVVAAAILLIIFRFPTRARVEELLRELAEPAP